MSRPRFLADHDLNEHIVTGVIRREPAVEFLRAREVGVASLTDREVIDYAVREGLVIVSHDVNTMPGHAYEMLRSGQPFAGLLMVQQKEPVGPVIESLVLIWAATEAEEWRNQILFLPLL